MISKRAEVIHCLLKSLDHFNLIHLAFMREGLMEFACKVCKYERSILWEANTETVIKVGFFTCLLSVTAGTNGKRFIQVDCIVPFHGLMIVTFPLNRHDEGNVVSMSQQFIVWDNSIIDCIKAHISDTLVCFFHLFSEIL